MIADLRETYNQMAEEWHSDHSTDTWWIEGMDAFVKNLPRNARILDVGCGGGTKAKYLVERGFRVTGIDIADKLLDIARREVPAGDFRALSMYDLDSIQEEFNGVFAQASLLHIPKKDAGELVKKMARRIAPGGFLYIAVKETRDDKPEEEIEKENDYGYEYERFFSYFTLAELRDYCTSVGLTIIYESRNPTPSGKTVWLQIIGQK